MIDQESLLSYQSLTDLENRQEKCLNIIGAGICVIIVIAVTGFLLSLYL